MDRLEQIRGYLAASMDGDKPKLGYKARVDAIKAEIKQLEAQETARTDDQQGIVP